MFFKKKNLLIFFITLFLVLLFGVTTVHAASIPTAVISMSPTENFTTETEIIFSADNSIPSDGATIVATYWGGDYSLTGLYTAGEHTVTLTVRDSNGQISQPAEFTFFVTEAIVNVEPPVAVITMSPNPNTTNITNLTNVFFSYENSTSYNGTFLNHEWRDAETRYPVGIHTVSLRVQDDRGTWSEWTSVTFEVYSAGEITGPTTGNKTPYSLREASGSTEKKIDETKFYDLTSLSFTVRYGDDTTKIISALETNASMDSRYRDIGYLTPDKKLIFYPDAEYGDYIIVSFTYTEKNVAVTEKVTFTYRRSSDIGLIQEMKTNVTEVQIPSDEIFYFEDILFHVLYDNGYEEYLTGNDINYELSEEFKDIFFVDDTGYEEGIKITPKVDATTGDYAYVEFWTKTNSFYQGLVDPNIPIKTFKKYIKFIVIDDEEEYITENSISYISCNDTVVGISDREKLDINSLEFVAHLYSGQLRKLYPTNFSLNMQYKYKQLVEYDEANRTIMFKPDTPYGTEIELNFVYNKVGATKYVNVKVVYVEGSPNYGSEISPIFTDISGHWAQSDILQMSLKNMVVGHSGSLYYPDRMVTRAEVASFISRYLELDKKNIEITESHFTDVLSYDHSYEDIEKVYMAGVFQGYSDGTFLPDALITRQELALVLYRTYQYKTGLTISGNNPYPFLDDGAIAIWAKDAIYSAKALGLIQGRTDGKFHPLDNTTRAEITAILNRMLNN